MAFMTYEITSKQPWWQVEDHDLAVTVFYPCKYFTKQSVAEMHNLDLDDEEQAERIEQIQGYGARLSAPGYLDATEWGVYDSRAAAWAALEEMYGNDEPDDEADDEAA